MTTRWVDDTPVRADLPLWTRALAAEILPNPVLPLDHDLLWEAAAAPAWADQLVDQLGFDRREIPEGQPNLVGFFNGYAYVNASLLRVWAARTPVLAPNHLDAAYLGDHPELTPYESAPWHQRPDMTRGPLSRWLSWVLVDNDQTLLEADHHASVRAHLDRPDLSLMSDIEVFELIVSHQPLCRQLFAQYLSQTLAASVGPGIVAAICDEIGLPTSATKLIAGLGGIDAVAPAQALWILSRLVRSSKPLTHAFDSGRAGLHRRLKTSPTTDGAAFVAGLDALLAEVGFMGSAEWELATPSWESEPDLALAAIDWLRRCDDGMDPTIGFARRETERKTLVKEIGDVVAGGPGSATREQFVAAISATGVFVRGREHSRSALSRVVNEIRIAVLELGERAAARHDIERREDLLFLFAEELRYYADGGLATVGELTTERRVVHGGVRQLEPPFVVDGRRLQQVTLVSSSSTEVAQLDTGEVLLAKPGSSEIGQGRSRIVIDLSAPDRFEPGDVIVTTAASAAWLPYLVGIAALVVESGSVLSQSAVMCRELGIPIVVGARGATDRIPDGALIDVDGVTGIITMIEHPPVPEPRNVAPPLDPWGVLDD